MLLLNFVSAFLSLSTFAYPRQTEILEEIGEDFGFNLEQMRFIPDWNVYGFLLPTNFDATVCWYNGMNGERIGDTDTVSLSVSDAGH